MVRWLPAIVALLALLALVIGVPQRLVHPDTALAVQVDVPEAPGAERVPAWRFVGPLDVEGLGYAELCGVTDRATLLRERRFGWRALMIAADGVRFPDGSVVTGDPRAAVNTLASRWASADRAVEVVCGVPPSTDVLVAIAGDAPADTLSASWFPDLGQAPIRLLVGAEAGDRIAVGDSVAVLSLATNPWGRPYSLLLQVIEVAGAAVAPAAQPGEPSAPTAP